MALHMIRPTPFFNKVMRGYDPEEVDEHLRSLDETDQDHLEALDAAEARVAALVAEVETLRERVVGLESSIRTETPRTIAAFGERLTMVLGEAEEAAQASLDAAAAEAAEVLAEANRKADEIERLAAEALADAEQRASARLALAAERATSTEAAATRRAGAAVEDAETWASRRRIEVEGWAADMRAHIDAERAREAEEFARIRTARTAELVELGRRRAALVDNLAAIGDAISRDVAAARAAAGAWSSAPSEEVDTASAELVDLTTSTGRRFPEPSDVPPADGDRDDTADGMEPVSAELA